MVKVRDIMTIEQNKDYIMKGKTGWGRKDGDDTGWWVGYIELSDNTVFFAARIIKKTEDKNPAFPDCRKSITKAALRYHGYIN